MKKVIVGMSGGVDSAVSAYLLKKDGYDVLGVTMKLLNNQETLDMINDAKKICNELDIPHQVFDFTKEFNDIVIKNFVDSYKDGLTPNPCVLCNKYFKFGLLYEKGKELGYDYLATGHYGKIENNCLLCSNTNKDQSYFLYSINKNILPFLIFPLANFKNKDEIREIARVNNLSVANKKDSQDICFITNNDYISFLNNYLKPIKGKISSINGQILGNHDGLYKYTIGQRKGLGISSNMPLYVIDIDINNNKLIVGENNDLFHTTLIADNINLLVNDINGELYGKIRSRGELTPCTAKIDNNKLIVTFKKPIRAITKGQSVVLYKENILLGGGIIKEVIK